ncbi:IS6 family transposase, partial [Methylobacterium nonmethylotrophicum]
FPSRTKRESRAGQSLLRPEPEFATGPLRASFQWSDCRNGCLARGTVSLCAADSCLNSRHV